MDFNAQYFRSGKENRSILVILNTKKMVNKLYDLAVMQPQVPQSIRAHYQALAARAEDCIACGNCEKRCPFGVPVVQRMEKVKELRLL